VFVALLTIAFLSREITPYIFDIFILGVAVVGAFEFSKILSKANLFNNKTASYIFPVASYILFVLAINLKLQIWLGVLLELALLVLVFALIFLTGIIFRKQTQNEIITRNITDTSIAKFAFKKALNTIFVFVYPTTLAFGILILNHFGDFGMYTGEYKKQISIFALLLAVVIPISNDTFAMLCGSLLKGKKLCPNISPNKTISGAVSGVVFGMLITCCLYLILASIDTFLVAFGDIKIEFWHIIILSFVTSILCQLGDLFESFAKRKAQIKDSGQVFPGHGGVLDRFDSHLFGYLPIICYLLFLI
jgi:phosphatidate cytidylyltransferase